jgi:hypothetical protein
MKKVGWAVACVAAGALVALVFYGAFRLLEYRSLPHVGEMKAACGIGGAVPPPVIPAYATPAKCREFFNDVWIFHRPRLIGTAITGLLAAFIFLVLRFRVRPLERR